MSTATAHSDGENPSGIDVIVVVFQHIATLWQYTDQCELIFITELVHCDPSDPIKHVQFVDCQFLLAAHQSFLNVWSLCPSPSQSESSEGLIEAQIAANKLQPRCVWSKAVNEILCVSENAFNRAQPILFIKKRQQEINDEVSSMIESETIFFSLGPFFKRC